MRTGWVASVLAALSLAGCVKTATGDCGAGQVCPTNTQCHAIAEPAMTTCVTVDQLGICGEDSDRTSCSIDGVVGTCFSGACFPADCGDELVDLTEACDDGNRIGGDLCSANCLSREVCGDGLVDPSLGEQCDDGGIGLSGDGCSSKCLKEYDLWSEHSPQSPPARTGHALAPAPGGGVMMFGGTLDGSAGAALSESWRWDGVTWTEVVSASPPPSPRSGAVAAFDPTRGHLIMFGGRDTNGGALDELWRWDGVAWSAITPAGTRPSARWDASVACSPTRCVLHGGRTATAVLGDTWIWNGTWTQLTGSGPPARSRAAFAYDTSRDVFVLFGSGHPMLQDSWELASQWTPISSFSNPPIGPQPSGAYDEAAGVVLVAVNGYTWKLESGQWDNAGWLYPHASPALVFDRDRERVIAVSEARTPTEWNPTTGWGQPLPNNRPQGGPLSMLATYSPRRGRTLVVEPSGTWEWDARSWQQVKLATPRPSPTNAGIAFDTACDEAVLFTGAQTWTYDGDWTRHVITAPPPTRTLHAMTYDAKRNVVVVFGGLSSSTLLADVWELGGACDARMWTQVPTTTGPSARKSARLAFDPVRGVSVLFGGEANQPVEDTWEWNGSAWMERSPTVKPPPRSEHAMAFDPRRGEVVMFGGEVGATLLGDTWSWNGTTWTKLLPITPVPARRGMAMSQDVTGALTIFGGQTEDTTSPNDVWRLGAETNVEPAERCTVGGVDEDGDGLMTCDDPDCGLRCAPLCTLGTSCTGPSCGDGTCGDVEDYVLCPADCTAP